MKHRLMYLILTVLVVSVFPISSKGTLEQPSGTTLTVYAYDSFVSEWGPGPSIIEEFSKQTGYNVQLISVGNASELLRRVVLERDNPKADVVVGLPHSIMLEMINTNLFESYDAPALAKVPDFLKIDHSNTFIPFNYGNFSFVYDSLKVSRPPESLDDLLDPRWKGKIILMDPRTSSVGMGLLEWTVAVYQDEYLSWWKAMKPNILTIADSWSSGYGLFTQHEGPVVISYTTSPVYHIMFEQTDRYRATVFNEGNQAVIEGMGILHSSDMKDASRAFVDYMLTDAQQTIAVANVMYPANSETALPEAFEFIPEVTKSLLLPLEILAKNRDEWLTKWVEVMSR